MNVDTNQPRAFLELTPEQQHAQLRAERNAVAESDVDEFLLGWSRAAMEYGAPWRVQALVHGVGAVAVYGDARMLVLSEGALFSRDATAGERRSLTDAIRSGAVQLEVHRGAGLLGATGPYIVLHQATGRFRPFQYGGYQMPEHGRMYQPYQHDPVQAARYEAFKAEEQEQQEG